MPPSQLYGCYADCPVGEDPLIFRLGGRRLLGFVSGVVPAGDPCCGAAFVLVLLGTGLACLRCDGLVVWAGFTDGL